MDYQEKALTRFKDKVCIVGCADSKNQTPFDDNNFEFWGVNNLYGTPLQGSHWDRWFEIHTIDFDGKTFFRRYKKEFRGQPVVDYMKNLSELPCMIYMQRHWNEIPNSVAYPIKEIVMAFGNYFTNTISYEIALAIYMGYQEIQIYGVDMAANAGNDFTANEYSYQRPSVEFFVGLALGRGIKVFIPEEADLLKSRFLYGFGERQQDAFTKKLNKVKFAMAERQAKALNELQQRQKTIEQYTGAIHAIEEIKKIWSNLGDDVIV